LLKKRQTFRQISSARRKPGRLPSWSCSRRAILFVGFARDDPQRIVWQRALQPLGSSHGTRTPHVEHLVSEQGSRFWISYIPAAACNLLWTNWLTWCVNKGVT